MAEPCDPLAGARKAGATNVSTRRDRSADHASGGALGSATGERGPAGAHPAVAGPEDLGQHAGDQGQDPAAPTPIATRIHCMSGIGGPPSVSSGMLLVLLLIDPLGLDG